MGEVLTSILTDASHRQTAAVETLLIQQANIAEPWQV